MMGEMGMKLRPSKYKLVTHNGQLLAYPLWERMEATDGHPATLIWVREGIFGEAPAASCASGRVPCCFSDPMDPLSMAGGCPLEGIEVKDVEGCDIVARTVIVKALDGVLEPATILVTERMELR